MAVPKVTDLGVEIGGGGNEDVAWLHVQVDDKVLVEELQTQGHLEDDHDLVAQVDLLRSVVEDELEVVAQQTLHYDEGVQGLLNDLK